MIMSPSRVRASAEAVFGSASRGDADHLSDRDILIVDHDVKILRSRAEELMAQGWSVASYTFRKLEALSKRGALFVQHLKLESQITHDDEGHLQAVLDRFCPRLSYESEIRDNDELSKLCGLVPAGPRGQLLSADILYVAVRNFGVLKLAERGVHKYSFSEIVDGLESEGFVARGSGQKLLRLRFLKCLYRAGESHVGALPRSIVEQALKALPRNHFPANVSVVDPHFILQCDAPNAKSSGYVQLRDLERRLVALKMTAPEDSANERLVRLERWISNPRAYVSVSSRSTPRLREWMARESLRNQPREGHSNLQLKRAW